MSASNIFKKWQENSVINSSSGIERQLNTLFTSLKNGGVSKKSAKHFIKKSTIFLTLNRETIEIIYRNSKAVREHFKNEETISEQWNQRLELLATKVFMNIYGLDTDQNPYGNSYVESFELLQ